MDIYNVISLLVSILALGASIYSVVQSNKANRYDLMIKWPTYTKLGSCFRLEFNIYNNSPKSITVDSMHFYSSSGNEFFPVAFDIEKYYESQRNNDDLFYMASLVYKSSIPQYEYPSDTKDNLISPYQHFPVTLYFKSLPNPVVIQLCANQKIGLFRKSKDYSIIPVQAD